MAACDGLVHRFAWYVRTCFCGAVSVPEPIVKPSRRPSLGKDAIAKRVAELAEAERRLAQGAPTSRPPRPPRPTPRTTTKRGRPAKV